MPRVHFVRVRSFIETLHILGICKYMVLEIDHSGTLNNFLLRIWSFRSSFLKPICQWCSVCKLKVHGSKVGPFVGRSPCVDFGLVSIQGLALPRFFESATKASSSLAIFGFHVSLPHRLQWFGSYLPQSMRLLML
jgi:hypothetical protein